MGSDTKPGLLEKSPETGGHFCSLAVGCIEGVTGVIQGVLGLWLRALAGQRG